MSKILLSAEELTSELKPLFDRLEKMEKNQAKLLSISNSVFSDQEAADFLKMSKKKLQSLRNDRKIGFVREPYGRKISYKLSHLVDFLNSNEIKAKNNLKTKIK